MSESAFYVLAALGILVILLEIVLLLRRVRIETPADLSARLGAIEQGLQGLTQASMRAQAGSERVERDMKAFTETTDAAMAASRLALDEQLSRTVEEGRQGRRELTEAFTAFEGKLQGRLGEFQKTTTESLEASRRAVDERLVTTLEEARQGRLEVVAAFQAFETKLDQRIAGFDTSLTTRFEALQTSLLNRLDETSKSLLEHLIQAQLDATNARTEMANVLATFKADISGTLTSLSGETTKSREALMESAATFQLRIQERFDTLTSMTRETFETVKSTISSQLGVMSTAVKDQLETNGTQISNQFLALQESVAQQLTSMAQGSAQTSEQLRATMNERLAAIQQDNTAKLEEMRRTVDEKLHATLEQRLGESFKLVSERLEQVHTGLGEMKTLAGSVGDLKRVMSNVRSRGTWGEVQLGAIIESLLTSEQYAKNVKTVSGSNDVVEFAVKMPGKSEDTPVWLPIDSKYPIEHYQRLLDAHDTLDKGLVQQAAAAFESSLRAEAKKISTKYLSPPDTTDFAILFLPTEGLFAEAARIPGLLESLQDSNRVVVAGPTTLSAVLNSLRLGFRTLAIEKRSSEVWSLLGGVKTEFQKFGETIDATNKHIAAAAKKFDDLGVRTRAIHRRLRQVELPAIASEASSKVEGLLGLDEDDAEAGDALAPV